MLIAYAPIAPSSDSNMQLVLISAGVVVVTALVAFVPVQLARQRHHRNLEAITAILLLWGLLTAGSISYFVMKQMDWSATYLQRIETGYYDPQNLSDKPTAPIGLWICVGGVYLAILLWATRKRTAENPRK